jgi:3',5'-cyclic AMP phosphodiesterase CpdA
VIPGNHDSRNVGYEHFEELFGERRSELHLDGVSIVAFDLDEFHDQAAQVTTGIAAMVQRACGEGTPLVMEGVHAVPGALPAGVREQCLMVEVLLVVEDEERHRGHFSLRRPLRRDPRAAGAPRRAGPGAGGRGARQRRRRRHPAGDDGPRPRHGR